MCGAQDSCGLIACENTLGEGCLCPQGRCWDGESCLSETETIAAVSRCYNTCDQPAEFDCVASCKPDRPKVSPTCIGSAWICPPEQGYFSSSLCGAHLPAECGGLAEVQCAEVLFCDYGDDNDGTCGRSGQMGACLEYRGCGEYVRDEACSCGGWVNTTPHCGPDDPFVDSGTYAICDEPREIAPRCGMWLYCGGSQYCVRTPTDQAGVFDYDCASIGWDSEDDPHTASCAGLAEEPCGADCAEVGGVVILTCRGACQ